MRRWLLLVAALAIGGCEKLARNMYDGARTRPLQAEGAGGPSTSRRLPDGVVARTSGDLAGSSSGTRGLDAARDAHAAELAQSMPYPVTARLLARGRERFEIYCAPCHSPLGDGDGLVARRGFPHPPDYRIARLRAAPDRHFYDVMTQGYGVMYAYADRVAPADRWAIVAWIRTLQRTPLPDGARSEAAQ